MKKFFNVLFILVKKKSNMRGIINYIMAYPLMKHLVMAKMMLTKHL